MMQRLGRKLARVRLKHLMIQELIMISIIGNRCSRRRKNRITSRSDYCGVVNCSLDKIEIFSALYGSLQYYEKMSFLYPKNQVPVLHIWSARRDSFKGI